VTLVWAGRLPGEVGPVLRRTVKNGNLHVVMLPLIFCAVLTVYVIVLLVILTPGAAWRSPANHQLMLFALSCSGLFFAYSAAVLLSSIGARRRGTAAMLACFRCGICPGCGYSIAGLATGGEGITRLPGVQRVLATA
jgi:hypothetical protein